MRSIQLQSPIWRVPTNNPRCKPISVPLLATTIEPTGKQAHATGIKPTTLPPDLSKHKCHCRHQAARLHNAMTPTTPNPRIRTQAQVVTVEHTFTNTTVGHATTNTSTRLHCSSNETATAAMRTRAPHTLHHTTGNKVHQAMAVMDKDRSKLLNYRHLMNSPKYKKTWSL
jgi:hypothetical protein